MNFIYILRPGRGTDQLEMRYSLRSIDRFHPFSTVYVVGAAYDWMQNYQLVPAGDRYEKKLQNVTAKIKAMTEADLPDGTYTYMNDDYILLQPRIHVNLYDQTLLQRSRSHRDEWTGRMMAYFCHIYGPEWVSYDNHRPFSFRMADARHIYSGIKRGEQHSFKTLMGNLSDRYPVARSPRDAKVTDPNANYSEIITKLRPDVLSVARPSWGRNLKQALSKEFSNKSRYER